MAGSLARSASSAPVVFVRLSSCGTRGRQIWQPSDPRSTLSSSTPNTSIIFVRPWVRRGGGLCPAAPVFFIRLHPPDPRPPEVPTLRFGLQPAAGDEIHILIASMDADGNGTIKFDELASSLAQLLLGLLQGAAWKSPAIRRSQATVPSARRRSPVHSSVIIDLEAPLRSSLPPLSNVDACCREEFFCSEPNSKLQDFLTVKLNYFGSLV